MAGFQLFLIFFSKFAFPKLKIMNLPKEFYTLTKEKQEEEANRITEKYYRMAEKWRKVAILVRTGKISSNPLEEVSRIGLN